MLFPKFKLAWIVLLLGVGITVGSAVALTWEALAGKQTEVPQQVASSSQDARPLTKPAAKPKDDNELLEGTTNAAAPVVLPQEGLSLEEFKKLHQEVRPSKDEVWRSIPWKLSLLEAQRLAAREQKPIFLWAMAGHPMACV
jgi:hypothetical protein